MKYYMDTEFHEYQKQPRFLGIPIGKPIDTIELISIGMVSENDETYYAVSNDFDVKAAWYKWQPRYEKRNMGMTRIEVKEYWLRENVLKPIFDEMVLLSNKAAIKQNHIIGYGGIVHHPDFTLRNFKKLLKRFGKSREEIAYGIKVFIADIGLKHEKSLNDRIELDKPKFYAYYADYDWVVFCWLFGRMVDLPNGFPYYCIDLKQRLDETLREKLSMQCFLTINGNKKQFDANKINANNLEEVLAWVKNLESYPKEINSHNALSDSIWNKKLHEFICILDK